MSVRQSKYQTSMQILRTIKDGRSSLIDIIESTYLNKKRVKDVVDQMVGQGFLEQEYNERGQKSDSYGVTKKGDKTLGEFEKVEALLREHAPEMLIKP
jgi:predicted transcriptional regulator